MGCGSLLATQLGLLGALELTELAVAFAVGSSVPSPYR